MPEQSVPARRAGPPWVDMEVFVARQPIFDRRLNLFAYELLFRSGLRNVFGQLNDGDRATLSVLTNSFLLIGMETLTSGKRSFINFTRNPLVQGMATTFPQDLVAVEVLETVAPDEDVVSACRQLREAGYLLVLDDFIFDAGYWPLIEMTDIVLQIPAFHQLRLFRPQTRGDLHPTGVDSSGHHRGEEVDDTDDAE